MDTPERSKVGGGGGTPLSNKFEDSPVFNFINSLSPIQPVKSTVQAYQPLSYSIFTSPHANSQKAPRAPMRNDPTEDSKGNDGCESSSPKAVTTITLFEPSNISQQTGAKCLLNQADKSLVFDSISPDHNTSYPHAFKTSFSSRSDLNKGGIQRKSLFASQTPSEGERNNDDADVAECDWEYLMSGNSEDLLICEDENEDEELVDRDNGSGAFLINNTQPNGIEDFHGERDVPLSYKGQTQNQRGMRRRCLVFDPSVSVSSRGKMVTKSPLKPKKSQVFPSLPGIGLHLNSLTATSKDLMNLSTFCVQKSEPDVLTIESNVDSNENVHDESALAIVPFDAAPPSPNNLKKKRRKAESGDGDGCKRCSCKKSKCLKLYCECFAAGVYCSEPCACQGCFNKPIHEETVLSTRKQIEFRNPLAFAPKVIRSSDEHQDNIPEDCNNTPASARHKRGCNCKKSSCLKKYCECFQGGVGCSASCRCETCKNTFGRREEAGIVAMADEEFGIGPDEISIGEEDEKPENGNQNASVQNIEQPCLDMVPITPSFESCGTMVKQQSYSSGKPPRPFVISTGDLSSGLYTCNSLLKCKNIASPCNEESPDHVLNDNYSHNNGGVTKTSSPNGKRVSPPQAIKGRKLILRAIPSFPSLTSDTYTGSFLNNGGL